jgi:flagellar FliL protein
MTSPVDENQVSKTAKKKNKIVLFAGVILFAAIAGGIFSFFNGQHQLAAMFAREAEIKSLTLPSLTVNLADRGYVKTTITLEYIASRELDKEMEANTYALKDSAIKVLRNTSFSSLQNPQATENLKKSLMQEINTTLTNGKITGLYFEEFIVQ